MNHGLPLRSWLLAMGILALTAGFLPGGEPAGKGDGKKEKEEEFDPRVILDEEEEVNGMIKAAWRARESNNWRLAIDKYLEAVRKYGNTVYRQSERLYLPVRVLIHRELLGMPKDGRELYQVLKGPEADQAYLRAAAAGDERALEQVAAEYPALDAAPRALFLLGEMARARGEPGRAVFHWRKLMSEYPEWSGGGRANLLARAALISVESGRPAEAGELVGQLKQIAGLTRMRLGGTEVLAADEIEKRMAAASGPAQPTTGGVREGWWPTIGGDSSHAGVAAHFVDAGVCRWQKKLAKGSEVNEQMARNYGLPTNTAQAKPPVRHPVAAGGMIVLAGDNNVLALRAMSGALVWKAPLQASNESLPVSRQTLPAIGEGRVYVSMGQRTAVNNQWFGGVQENRSTSAVVLRAYGLESGKLVWESGREDNKTLAEFLKSVDLVGAPVYAGGFVYCPAVKRGSINDVHLLCFDASSGRLAWKPTFICAGQALTAGQYYAQLPITEDCPAAAIGEGLAAVITNAGALGVVDVASGQPVWIYLYDRLDVSAKIDRLKPGQMTVPEIWAPCPPIISGGMVFAAPQDCGELLAMELATGRLKWKARRGAMRHVVGTSGGYLILSGNKEVVALSAANGKRVWSATLAAEATGLGLVGRDFVIVPTKVSLQRFDLATGEPKASYLFKQGDAESGNLVISGDILVSVGHEAAAGYYAWDHIVNKLRAEIAATPAAAAPRAELAEVHFSAEKYPEAIDIFKEALERVKPEETQGGVPLANTIKKQIWEAYSRLGRSAAEKDRDSGLALKNYQEAHKFRTASNEEMIGHMRFAQCREALGEFAAAAADYQTVIARLAEEIYQRPGTGEVQSGRFAQTQIERLIKEKGREVYARFDREADDLLAKARAEKQSATAQRVIKEYPNSQAVSPALILLSELAMEAKRPNDAAASLREHLWKRAGSEREPEVRARLAMAYRAQGMESLCRGMLNRMVRTCPEKTFALDGRNWSVKDFVAEKLPGGATAGPALDPGRPDLTPPLATVWQAGIGGIGAYLVPSDPHLGGPEGMVVCAAQDPGRTGQNLAAIHAGSGKLAWKTSVQSQVAFGNTQQGFLALPGSVLMVSGNKLKCLAAGNGQPMWERELAIEQVDRRWGGYSQSMLAAGDGVVVVVAASVSVNPQTGAQTWKQTVTAFDEGAGQQIWSAGGDAGNQLLQVAVAEGLLLVHGQDQRGTGERKVVAYDLADGRKRYDIGLKGWGGNFTVQNEHIIFSSQGSLDCYELSTGKLKWRGPGGANRGLPTVIASDDERIVTAEPQAAGGKSSLVAWDLATGKRLWSADLPGNVYQGYNQFGQPIAGAAIRNTARLALTIYDNATRKAAVVAYDGTTGKLLWRSDLPLNVQIPALVVGSQHVAGVVLQAGGGNLRVWDLETGKLVESRGVKEAGNLAVQQGVVLIMGQQGGVERLQSGKSGPPAPAPEPR
jgi:outer membrane protein assembly factor BamB